MKQSLSEAREVFIMLSEWPEKKRNDFLSLVTQEIGYSPILFGQKRDATILLLLQRPINKLDTDDLRELRDYLSDVPDGHLAAEVAQKLSETGLDI